MARSLPGKERVEGREFIYLDASKCRSFTGLLQDLLTSCPDTPMPQSGGLLEEKASLILPDKTSLLAVSFKGDLLGWRNKILGYCRENGLKWAVLDEQLVVLSDGTSIPLTRCKVKFET